MWAEVWAVAVAVVVNTSLAEVKGGECMHVQDSCTNTRTYTQVEATWPELLRQNGVM